MDASVDPNAAVNSGTLSYLPVASFGSVMGLCGLAVAWRLAHRLYGAPEWAGQLTGAAAVLAFIALAMARASRR